MEATMTKRALCIGINDYPGTGSDLAGCVNDARDWGGALQGRGFEVTTLLDSDATKANMAAAIGELVRGTGYGDLGVITYSGHGTWVPDRDGDEPDQRDEALCPYDISQHNLLLDDELYEIFDDRQRGARILFISDSCHSGSVSRVGAPAGDNPSKIRFLPPETFLDARELTVARHLPPVGRGRSRTHAALLFSGSQDWEYSYDASFGGRPNGAFTYFALQTLPGLPASASYRDWYHKIREKLPAQNYPQTPNFQGSTGMKRRPILSEGR
jgi:hypothetical protein